jgi:hypothetical protein
VLVVAALAAVWAFAPIVYLVVDVLRDGGVLSGAGSATAGADQFQYLSWIREAGAHGLIANQFELAPNPAAFLHPMFLLSGIAWRLGLPLQLALLFWEPIAIVVMVGGFAAYVARSEHGRARLGVLLLAIFYLTPMLAVLDWTHQLRFAQVFELHLGMEELSPAWQLWGYLPTAISLGLMPLALLAGERALEHRARNRYLPAAAAASLAVAWLHPWQGATLVLVWIGIVCWGRGWRARLPLLVPAGIALLPLIYYQLLARYDHAWQVAQAQNRQPHFPVWVLAAALGPLAVPALVGLLNRPRDAHERITRLWVGAGLLVYFAGHTFELHALQGLSLPLAVLAAAGWRRAFRAQSGAGSPPQTSHGLRSSAAGARLSAVAATLAIALVTVPGVIWSAAWYRTSIRGHFEPYIFTASEHAALTFLEHAPRRGGVLAGRYLGMAVPAFTGRSTWVGHKVWTPDYAQRVNQAGALLSGRLGPRRARSLVRSAGAAYLLSDCSDRADMRKLLGPIVTGVDRFGCVRVYALAPA